MNVSFLGNLKIDKSFYTLKQSNCKEIVDYAQKLYDTPKLSDLIPDTTLYGKGAKSGDRVVIKFGKHWNIPIVTKGEVKAGAVLQQILLNTCFYHDENPRFCSYECIMDTIKKIIKKNEMK